MDFPNLSSVKVLGLDYETSSLQYWQPDFRVLGFGIAIPGHEWYFDLRRDPGATQWLRDTLPWKMAVAHNAQFDYQATRWMGIDPRAVSWYCTMVADCLIDEHSLTYNLEDVAVRWNVRSGKKAHLDALAAALGVNTHGEVFPLLDTAPPALVSAYGSNDARMALQIRAAQQEEILAQDLGRVLALEMELLPVLADMSYYGVRVDLDGAHAAIPQLDEQAVVLAANIKEQVGCPDPAIFVNSPKQMREFFKPEPIHTYQWRTIDGTLVGPTKGGKSPSLGQEALRNMSHPVAKNILALRKAIKLRDTFLRGHVIASADERSYVHTTFNQTRTDQDAGTVTGRLSSTDPALQQITKRDKIAAAILRALFLADEGFDWLTLDYSQVDFRCAAHLINDRAILQAYDDDHDLDYHQIVSDMTGIPRNPAYAGAPNTKTLNLSLAFGAGAGKIAASMGMPHTIGEFRGRMAYLAGPEAQAILEQYHARLPGVRKFAKRAEQVAKANGFVKTQMGRRLRFPNYGQHKASGLLYQAYAADLHKVGLIDTDKYLRDEKCGRLLVSVHDEIGVSIHPDNHKHLEGIRHAYTDFNSETSRIKMNVPITASGSFGPNWWEASK